MFLFKIVQTIVARKQIAVLTEQEKANSADAVMKLLRCSRKKLLAADEMFAVEIGLLNMLCGATAKQRVREVLSSKLAAADREVTEEQAAQSIRDIVAHDGFRFLPHTEQAVVRFTGTMLAAIQNGTTDDLKLTQVGETIVHLWQQCGHFCRFTGPLKAGEDAKAHTADAALVATMHKVQLKVKDADLAADFERLCKYQFCAKAERKAEVRRTLATRLAPAPKQKAKKEVATSKRNQAQQDAAEAAAAAVFSGACSPVSFFFMQPSA